MRYLALVLLLFGCSKASDPARAKIVAPGASVAPSCVAEAAVAQFRGFPDIPDHDVLPLAGTSAFAETTFSDPDISAAEGEITIKTNDFDGSLSGFTYATGPLSLFAPGDKYDKVNFQSDLLCADWDGLTPLSKFPNLGARSYVWHGDSLNVQAEDRNLAFRWKGWTLVCNEEIQGPGFVEINAAHLIGPAGREVKLSHFRVNCPQ